MTTNQKHITAVANIIPSPSGKTIIVTEYVNPERILTPLLLAHLDNLGFASIYPNFGNVRVSGVHPFAMFLLATVQGTKIDLGVLPAITISDSSDGEDAPVLGRDFVGGTLGADDVARLKGFTQMDQLIISSINIARLEAATQGGARIAFTKRTMISKHSVDFNIWADNKDVTSVLYDVVRLFLYHGVDEIGRNGLSFLGGISGRRSGDINLEFGRLLYGSNVTAPMTCQSSVMAVDIPLDIIDNIDVQADYHLADEA
jgi:hypothetical protein